MKTSANTHSGLKRNENFASTGKDLRDWPGRNGARDSAAYVGGNGAGTVTAPARVGLLSVRGVGVRTMFGMVPHRAVAGARLCVSDSYTRLSVCLILHIR